MTFRFLRFSAAILPSALLCTGCASSGSKQLATELGSSAAGLADAIQTPLLDIRNTEMRFRSEANAASTQPQGWDNATKEAAIDRDDVLLRVTLLKEIGLYGTALAVLASDAEPARIDAATKDLYGALSGLNTTVGNIQRKKKADAKDPVSVDDLALVATLTNVAGHWIYEYERVKALRLVTKKAGLVIPDVVAAFNEELAVQGPWLQTYRTSLEGISRELYRRSTLPGISADAKAALLSDAIRFRNQASGASTLFESAFTALDTFAAGHKTLEDALEAESSVTLRNATERIAAFSAEVARIEAYKAMLDAEKATSK